MSTKRPSRTTKKPSIHLTASVDSNRSAVDHLRELIASSKLRPGDRLPPERELAAQFGITRGDVRRGIGYLSALGILEVRHGVGAFLSDTSRSIGDHPLQVLRSVGALETEHIFEARRALEVAIAGLAAERCRDDQLGPMAEELAEMFATVADAEPFLIHDVRFHRAVAQASGNPVLVSLMESIAGTLYEERRVRAGTLSNRQSALVSHREIYHAIRRRDPEAARRAMSQHLKTAAANSIPGQ